MKKSILVLGVSTFILGCSMLKLEATKPKTNELSHFSAHHNTIYYKDEPMAKLQAITYSSEFDGMVKEMNFKLIDSSKSNVIGLMINYLSKTHSEEIEVEVEVYDEK